MNHTEADAPVRELPVLSDTLQEITQAQFDEFVDVARQLIAQSQSPQQLQQYRVQLTGKKSALTGWSKQLGKLDADDKKHFGGLLHQVRSSIQQALDTQQQALEVASLQAQLDAERIDITLPARGSQKGRLHPITMTTQRMQQFFVQAGFNVATGPEVESDYYNFEALNIPSHHPARAMHDTFYFDAHYLLRTHTSPVQIRTMEAG